MMDSFEMAKIAGGVLSALLVIVGFKTFLDQQMAGEAGHVSATAGYALPTATAKAEGGAAPAAAETAFDAAKVVAAVGAAKPENGETIFKRCAGCHVNDKGAKATVAPNLWGVVGRKPGSAEFGGYSDAMKGKGGEWTFADLATFIHAPKATVAGTKMNFPGIADPGELADLLAYLRKQSDSPAPLP